MVKYMRENGTKANRKDSAAKFGQMAGGTKEPGTKANRLAKALKLTKMAL